MEKSEKRKINMLIKRISDQIKKNVCGFWKKRGCKAEFTKIGKEKKNAILI